MPRANWEDGAEIVKQDLNATSKALQRELYDRIVYEMVARSEDSFFSDSFKVTYSAANQVLVTKGLGFQTDNTQVSPEPNKRMLFLPNNTAALLSAPNNVNNRIDIVCVKAAIVDELTGSRKYKDATPAGVVSTQSLVIQKDWEAEILVVDGTPNVSPTVPATPAGYIKIAELLITAVSGLANSGAITDKRSLMPIGGSAPINTIGFSRLTAGAAVAISTLFADTDALLKNGHYEYFDVDDLIADPAAPANASGKRRIYSKNGVLYVREQGPGGAIAPIGAGGGGGAGANWVPVAGAGPIISNEYDEKVFLFEQAALQKITLWLKVPTSYLAGRQISMKGGFYSPGNTLNFRFQAVATLIRKNNDAVTSTANQNTANTGDILNAVANRFREVSVTLSEADGEINGVGISPGDLIKVELSRVAPSGSEDLNDVRFIPSTTEVSFG